MLIIKLGPDFEIDVDTPVSRGHSDRELLFRILAHQKHYQHQLNEIRTTMITAEKLQASSDALTAAVTGAIALIPSGTPASTPDATVLAFQSNVDAQTSRLNAAENTVTPPPPPAP